MVTFFGRSPTRSLRSLRSLRGHYAVTTQSLRLLRGLHSPCNYYSSYAVIMRTTRLKSGLRLRNAQLRSKSRLKAS